MPWVKKPPPSGVSTATPVVPPGVVTPSVPIAPRPISAPELMAIPFPAHTTIQNARNAGAVEGTMLVAPLAPASGPITVNVADVIPAKTTTAPDGTKTTTPAQEPMVVVAVKAFWQSPTIKAARNVIGLAVTAVLGVFATTVMGVWTSGHSIFTKGAVNWRATEIAAEIAGGLIVGSAVLAWVRRSDNNPIQK